MVRKHYYNFRSFANMLKLRSRGFDRAQYCNVNQVCKQISQQFSENSVYKGEFKILSNIWDEAFSAKSLLAS